MCSRPTWCAGALAGLLVLTVACGHKGPPKPPPQKIPAPIGDLIVKQRGNEILADFSYPTTTIAGLPIEDVIAVELWEYTIPVPDFTSEALGDEDEDGDEPRDDEGGGESDAEDEGQEESGELLEELPAESPEDEAAGDEPESDEPEGEEPEADETEPPEDESDDEPGDQDDERTPADPLALAASKESLLEFDPLEFIAGAKLTARLEGIDLASAIRGDRVYMRVPLERIRPGEKEAKVYGVKSFQRLDRASAFSNLYTIIPRRTPDPPTELEAQATPAGVRIRWTFEDDDPMEFRFYRRDDLTPIYGLHLGVQEGSERRFLDSGAAFGATYKYVVTAVVHRDPLVESNFSEELEWEFLDDFPPAPPTNLVILPEAGVARLLWDASTDEDLAGYLVYRQTPGGDYEQLNDTPTRSTEYVDRTADSGRTFFYRIVAVDSYGNESDPSEEVEVRIP